MAAVVLAVGIQSAGAFVALAQDTAPRALEFAGNVVALVVVGYLVTKFAV